MPVLDNEAPPHARKGSTCHALSSGGFVEGMLQAGDAQRTCRLEMQRSRTPRWRALTRQAPC